MHKEVERIRSKRAQSPWPKYLRSVQIDGFRGWTGQEIRFEFPVAVVCGENGSGKSTVLKAAASLYQHPSSPNKSYFPSTFFPDTPWDQVTNATLTWQLVEGNNVRSFTVRKLSERWRFQKNRPKRHVVVQDVSRTLPLDATVGYAYIAKRTAQEVSAQSLSPELTTYFASIMGRPYDSARFALADVDRYRQVGVVTAGNLEFSQFHQGAGEDATLDLIALLQNVPDTALVVLDEAEASLHPRSQRRLIHFLLWLARTKQLQIILSTHSPYILEELPPEARIFLDRTTAGISVLYGVTPELVLNRMDDIDKPDAYVMTEDEEAAILATTILRAAGVDITRISFVPVGPANIVAAIGIAALSPRFPVKAIGVVDADQQAQQGSVKFPGSYCPEKQLLDDIKAHASAQLGARLGLSFDAVQTAISRATSAPDPHDWPDHLARRTGQTVSYLWETLAQVWVTECLSEQDIEGFAQPVRNLLP
jgi:predicted ATPase